MTKNLTRLLSVMIALATSFPLLAMPVLADGVSYSYWDYEQPEPVREESQYALINFADGYEKMVIQISINYWELQNGEKMLWIFPVPASPEDVDLDLMYGGYFPDLAGHYVRDIARQSVDNSLFLASATQIYALPFSMLFSLDSREPARKVHYVESESAVSTSGNLTVHEHIERFGLATEIIATDDRLALIEYLEERNITLPESAMAAIDDYIQKEYSFSLSWISNTSQFRQEADPDWGIYDLGVSLGFPTDRIFFPLRLTSVYGDLTIPIVLQIIDSVVPAEGQPVVDSIGMSVEYAYASSVFVAKAASSFFEEQVETTNAQIMTDDGNAGYNLDISYTLVMIDSPSYKFTDDIWFTEGSSLEASYLQSIKSYWMIVSILMIIAISMVSSVISGMIVFRGLEPQKKKFALLGLSNLLTLIGIAAISTRLKINYRYISKDALERNFEEMSGPVEPAPVRYYLLVFTMVYLGLLILAHAAWYVTI
jgi:hypothetical protein